MKYQDETIALHGGQSPDAETGSRAMPLYRTTAYSFKNCQHAADLFDLKEEGFIYTRIGNPTQEVLEKRLAELEGGQAALAVASGTAAIFYSIINLAFAGEEIIAFENLYGGTHTLFSSILPDLGITVRFVAPNDLEGLKKAIGEKSRAVFTETMGNPALDVADIQAIAAIAHEAGLPLLVDSTFTPPPICKPIEQGADIVIHSLTKWISGHGTVMGGAVIDAGLFDWGSGLHRRYVEEDPSYHGIRWAKDLGEHNHLAFINRMRTVALRNIGASISPDNAWHILEGLETLPLRMERHSTNAAAVADFLSQHPSIEWVRYPGLKGSPEKATADRLFCRHSPGYGGMLVFGIKGGKEAGRRFIEHLRLFSHVANVGDAKSLAIHPGSTTHSQLSDEAQKAAGVRPELIRLSIGLESKDDIIADLEKALQEVE